MLAQQFGDPPAKVIPANHVVKLREQVGKNVTVQGLIESTGESKSGIQFLNFQSSELTAVCYRDNVARFTDGKPSVLYRNKVVELTGKVTLYRNKLQIELAKPSQIRIVTRAAAAPQGVELKKIGEDTWISPAGLRYRGRDPAGLTRVEHIKRHTRDEPNRAGPHGVFDGGSKVAFAVIDEAWNLATDKKLQPEREGDRSSYTVSMGRRIGYLGGQVGQKSDTRL